MTYSAEWGELKSPTPHVSPNAAPALSTFVDMSSESTREVWLRQMGNMVLFTSNLRFEMLVCRVLLELPRTTRVFT